MFKLVLILVIAVVLVGVVLFLAVNAVFNAFEDFQFLPDPDPLPHTRVDSQETYPNITMDLTPREIETLGNATGNQLLVVRDATSFVISFASNDLFADNVTTRTVCELTNSSGAGDLVQLGILANGAVAVSCEDQGVDRYWVLTNWTGEWVEVPGPLDILTVDVNGMEPETIPFPRHIENWDNGWDFKRIDRFEVAVGTYWYVAGCMEGYNSPAVVYRRPGGEWSTMVSLNKRTSAEYISVAGTAMDDLFVVAYDDRYRTGWRVYGVTNDDLIEAGSNPPEWGVD
jgi:hypothetical protein